ncbi:MAG: DUF4080 domain-containing protein [Provencibacterium sp.]|jgi:radical SAM superfamily enzyme YgiQ (UPF0313 family)|nr:DUF4080 domain-containing protein [Provencibacterium sp.]
MHALIIGLNAKYTHTALAARSISAYACGHGCPLPFAEYCINQPYARILEELVRRQADTFLFSCYLWNWELVRRLAGDLKAVFPQARIFLGGPQVSFSAARILRGLPQADGILTGEGEHTVLLLLQALESGSALSTVPSLTWRLPDGEIRQNPLAEPLNMAGLPGCYPDLGALSGRTLYYESSRGCPFSCSYCLSGLDRTVRFKPLGQVFSELSIFLKAGVRRVKFCDRTFNCRPEHCESIWRFLIEQDNGVSCFHFEITAELLTEKQLQLLSKARKGLFQFEIGVQSTHPPTLAAIRRRTDMERLQAVCHALQKMGNIHLHLDLIAGLPLESFSRFACSFNEVYALRPDQLQLGFLKLLPGSALERDAKYYGLVCSAHPPYEVLRTALLTAEELFELKAAEEALERFHNSGAFCRSLRYALSFAEDAFHLFQGLGRFCREQEKEGPASFHGLFTLFYRYACGLPSLDKELLRALLCYDLCRYGRPKKLPDCLQAAEKEKSAACRRAFYRNPGRLAAAGLSGLNDAALRRDTHLECFSYDLLSPGYEKRATALLFRYDGEVRVQRVLLEES